MKAKQQELKRAIEEKLVVAREIASKAESEDRDFTDTERSTVKAALDDVKKIKAELDGLNADSDLVDQIKSFGELGGAPARPEDVDPMSEGQRRKYRRSMGHEFVERDEWGAWMKQIAPNGEIPDTMKGINGPPMPFSYGDLRSKALITGTSETSAGALVYPQDLGLQVGPQPFQRPLEVVDAITTGTTQSDQVTYARVTGFTNNAAAVAEATATSGTSGTKPESAMVLERVTTNVKTLAHWMPATKRSLSDAGQVRTLIDNFLEYGLNEEIEDQIVNGDGIGENFTGIGNTSGVQAQAWDTDLLVTTRKAKTKVRLNGRAVPSAYMLNPLDNEALDLLRENGATGLFLRGGPFAANVPSLWALPVIETEAVPVGVGYVGDFRQAVLWDREQAAITVSDSHADFFVRNLVAILAELRAAFGIFRPAAFVEMDLTAL